MIIVHLKMIVSELVHYERVKVKSQTNNIFCYKLKEKLEMIDRVKTIKDQVKTIKDQVKI
jgi:hypothetical protein